MQFQFDAKQDYQLHAIEAVADLFEGQPHLAASIIFSLSSQGGLAAIPNQLDLDDTGLLKNLRAVQQRNRIAPDFEMKQIVNTVATATGAKAVRFANFSVEMETGTGKTYVYLRTALELNRRYGMRKFIIVVPSVAIREGVLKTLRVTEEHLRSLYDNVVYRYGEYDSTNLNQVRQFALSDAVEMMVMTIDSFNKAANVIRQSTDRLQGETPIHLVQATRPILILDEPQNMESEKSIAALALLDPLFALRYSATHRNPYNIVNRLTPAEAYRQGLVKKIEVASVVRESDVNRPYLCVEKIESKKTKITAVLRLHKLLKTGAVQETKVTVRPGDSLEEKTGRPEYAPYTVDEINPGGQFVRFGNNLELRRGEDAGADRDAIFAAQIRHTVEQHLQKQSRLRERGIKVLSLFFIDRVENYAGQPAPNDPQDRRGIIKRLFRQAFNDLKAGYPDFRDLDGDAVQAAYFAQKRRKGGEIEWLDSTEGRDKKEDQAAYDLIMRDKEALLSFPDPQDDDETRRKKQVAFIFSHSALREGWDNPNVFQICTLNQTMSVNRKRQEVGRGVRLAVDQSGARVRDESINVLTVVANESYRQYVETYQKEILDEYQAEIEARYGKRLDELSDAERLAIEQEYGESVLPPPPREAGKGKAKLRKARALSDEFRQLWEHIKHKTRYAVQFDTEVFLAEVLPAIEAADVPPPRVTITKASVSVDDEGLFTAAQSSGVKTVANLAGRYPLPNLLGVMGNLMEHTSPPVKLTRRTLAQLFSRLSNPRKALANPHEWASIAVRIVKEQLADYLVNGIQYEKTGEWYDMRQILDDEEIELFSKYIVADASTDEKSVYDLVPCDSEVEKQFVKDLESRADVKVYVKLPYWFTVPTPVGEYEPDWAIVMQDPDKDSQPVLYLVTETKGTTNLDDLRPDEKRKILCGAAHFGSKQLDKAGALDDVDFKVVVSAGAIP
jgi:type III restriction enzyme